MAMAMAIGDGDGDGTRQYQARRVLDGILVFEIKTLATVGIQQLICCSVPAAYSYSCTACTVEYCSLRMLKVVRSNPYMESNPAGYCILYVHVVEQRIILLLYALHITVLVEYLAIRAPSKNTHTVLCALCMKINKAKQAKK